MVDKVALLFHGRISIYDAGYEEPPYKAGRRSGGTRHLDIYPHSSLQGIVQLVHHSRIIAYINTS